MSKLSGTAGHSDGQGFCCGSGAGEGDSPGQGSRNGLGSAGGSPAGSSNGISPGRCCVILRLCFKDSPRSIGQRSVTPLKPRQTYGCLRMRPRMGGCELTALQWPAAASGLRKTPDSRSDLAPPYSGVAGGNVMRQISPVNAGFAVGRAAAA
jgi:hypothetical protein